MDSEARPNWIQKVPLPFVVYRTLEKLISLALSFLVYELKVIITPVSLGY